MLREARGPAASARCRGRPARPRGARVEPLRPRPSARPGPAHRPKRRSRRCRAPSPSFPREKWPLVTPVPPRPSLPRRSPQLLLAPPRPAPVPVTQRLSSGCAPPAGRVSGHTHTWLRGRGWRRAQCAQPGATPLALGGGKPPCASPVAGPTEERKQAPQNQQPKQRSSARVSYWALCHGGRNRAVLFIVGVEKRKS